MTPVRRQFRYKRENHYLVVRCELNPKGIFKFKTYTVKNGSWAQVSLETLDFIDDQWARFEHLHNVVLATGREEQDVTRIHFALNAGFGRGTVNVLIDKLQIRKFEAERLAEFYQGASVEDVEELLETLGARLRRFAKTAEAWLKSSDKPCPAPEPITKAHYDEMGLDITSL